MSAAAARIQVSREQSGAWLYGRWTDLFVGCGLSYLLSLPLLFAISEWTGVTSWPVTYLVVFGLLINGPHYGATLVRVYDVREDRRKYAIFAVYITLLMVVLFALASRSLLLASILVTAYLTWSPWHFSGQNYGLMLMFLRRRGIDVNPLTKRLVHASFVLSAVLGILAVHGGSEAFVFAPATLPVANTPSILSLQVPAPLVAPLWATLLLAYLGCLGASLWRLSRRARLRDLAPAFLLVLTQALWFSVPAFVSQMRATRTETLVFSAIWISTWHSLQYLWITTYYARSSGSREPARRFLLKSFIAGAGVTALPGLVMSPQWLGSVPWDAGLAATTFSVVNLHHFILDGAIWKLRDGRVARVLLRAPEPPEPGASAPSPRLPWMRTLVWSLAALGLCVPLVEVYGRSTLSQATTQPEQVERSTHLLKWVGRETIKMHYSIGATYARRGNHDEAIAHYRRSLELFPTGRVWLALGSEYRALGRREEAREAFSAAIALNPNIAAPQEPRALKTEHP
jgi:hypothetical protein